jgi:Holliday junction DNA helicase RuvB
MRGPFHDPHHGETREIRLARHGRAGEPIGKRRSVRAAPPLVPLPGDPLARYRAPQFPGGTNVQLQPADLDGARNPLRPATLDEMVGQRKLKPLLRRLIDSALRDGRRLDHLLMVGASGTGKTTTATVIAREMHTRVFLLKAPLDQAALDSLRTGGLDGDIVFVDEIHLWASGDRRGRTEACDPESVYTLLEDGVLMTPRGVLPFPDVTWLGATTDVGLLPEPLVNRFPIQPRLEPYTTEDMEEIARRNASAFGLTLGQGADLIFGRASRQNPRLVNSYLRSAKALASGPVTRHLAQEVVQDLAGTTLDGLDPSMQAMLRYLYRYGRRETKTGTTYQASAGALATAAGHGRDLKAVYTKEAYLIERGLLTVQAGKGRMLTENGIQRAKELV